MDSLNNFFQELYKNFNDRKIDVVISKMTDNVKWANGMEGGYVYGHNAPLFVELSILWQLRQVTTCNIFCSFWEAI